MCAVYTQSSGKETYYDGIRLQNGFEERTFTVMIVTQEGKSAASIQGGIITTFVMYDSESEPICSFHDGNWEEKLNPNDGMANFALSHFVSEYNTRRRRSKIRSYGRYLDALDDVRAKNNDYNEGLNILTYQKKERRTMANKEIKNEEAKVEETKKTETEEKKATEVKLEKKENKGLVGWFKGLSTPAKIITGVVTTAVVGGIGFGVKVLIDVLTGGDDEEATSETDTPADE